MWKKIWSHNLSFFGLGPWAIIHGIWPKLANSFISQIWILFERYFSKLLENHKIVEIKYTEFKLYKVADRVPKLLIKQSRGCSWTAVTYSIIEKCMQYKTMSNCTCTCTKFPQWDTNTLVLLRPSPYPRKYSEYFDWTQGQPGDANGLLGRGHLLWDQCSGWELPESVRGSWVHVQTQAPSLVSVILLALHACVCVWCVCA